MEILFLGTGSGVPSKQRNVSSLALKMLQETGSVWLFDCGEATQHQIMQTSLKPRKITKIFITHMHGDHIFGLPGLLSSRAFQGGVEPVEIYGPAGLEEYVKVSLKNSGSHLPYSLHFTEIFDDWYMEDEDFKLSAKELEHGLPSYGFRIEQKSKIGELNPAKLKEAGINPGPIYKQIKENEYIELEDGRIIERKDYLGPEKKGKIISILGDTRFNEEFSSFIQGSDLLIHEATFREKDRSLAFDYYHSTTTEAASLAKKGEVKRLILNHVSSRYQGETILELLEEAKAIFPNCSIAFDFHSTVIE